MNNNFIIASRAYFLQASTQDTSRYTKPCAGYPDPLVYPPSSFCSAWRSPAEIILHQQPSPHRRAAGTHLLLRPSCWIKKARTSPS